MTIGRDGGAQEGFSHVLFRKEGVNGRTKWLRGLRPTDDQRVLFGPVPPLFGRKYVSPNYNIAGFLGSDTADAGSTTKR